MAEQTPLYDLVLLLSTASEADERSKILADIESVIASAGGSVERNDTWGVRPLTFRIRHESEADYHMLQFTGPTSLLESLSHSLRIADDVLRFRIIKNLPGTPAAPESAPPVIAGTHHGTSSGATAGAGAGAGAATSAGSRDADAESE
ncbi:MAG TPA: 30S ribosomal protein S6 [Solirubrobacteraceae bacterium]|jgi:small subunit ribosomal protein S6